VARFLAGAAACFLLLTGVFLFWQSRAEQAPMLPAAPPPQTSAPSMVVQEELPLPMPKAPEASARTREQKRFDRTDKDKDGRITREELLAPRRKAFAKLDQNGDGRLSFEEWAVKTIEKFNGADKDRSGWLSRAEYATTAPPPPKKKAACKC